MEVIPKNQKDQLKAELEQFSSDRINFKLSLRKKKFNNILAKKRILYSNLSTSNYSLEFNLTKLNLPENYKDKFNDNDELMCTALKSIKSDDPLTVKYGICLFKLYIKYFIDNKDIIFNLNLNFISDLLNILEKWGEKGEKDIVFNILLIMTNYSYLNTNKTICKILLSSKGYKIWDLCFNMQDYEIMSQLVWILNNIIYEDKDSSYNLLKSNYFNKKIFSFYSNPTIISHLNEKDENNIFYILIDRGINLMANLLETKCSSTYEKEEKYKLAIPIFNLILKYSETNSPNIFYVCLYAINLALEKEGRLINLISSSNILKDILDKKLFEHENIVLYTNRIIGEYTAFIPDLAQEFYDKCLNYEMDILFSAKSHIVIKEVFWVLSNIFHDNLNSITNAINNGPFMDKVFYLYKNPIEYDDINQICYFFTTLVQQSNLDNFSKLLNKGLLDISLQHLKMTFDEPKRVKLILELIENCLHTGKTWGSNLIKEKCDNFGLRDILSNYEDTDDEELEDIVEKIITDYYDN